MNFKFKSLLFSTIICFSNIADCQVINFTEQYELVDLSCTTTVDCSRFEQAHQNITCLDGKCTCYDKSSREILCSLPSTLYNNFVGGACPCKVEHSECNKLSQVCYCKKDYIASLDKRRCIKKQVHLNETCEDDSQCVYQEEFSECDLKLKICKCQKHFVEYNKGCVSVVNLDDPCDTDLQCNVETPNSICIFRKCLCEPGYIANLEKTKCLPGAGYNEDCIEDNQCRLKLGVGSICYSGKCSCDIKHQLLKLEEKINNTIFYSCEKDVHFGDYCYEHNDCYRFEEDSKHQSMQCVDSECVCRPDFSNVNNTCISNGASINVINKLLIIAVAIMSIIMITYGINSIPKGYDL